MIKLSKIITIIGGGTPSKLISHYWNGSIPWASVKDLRSDYIEKTIDSITLEAVSNSATQIIPKGSIIIGTRMAVGKVSVNLVDLAINQDLKAIICSDKVFYKFLFYFLKSKEEYLNSIASGATVKGIKLEHIKNLEIPLPPLATQKHIADILDAADALRRKTQQIVDSYDELAQSLFLEMFGDPVKNEKRWDRKTIGELCEKIQIGPFGSQIHQSDYCEVGIPLINPTNISKDGIDYDNAVRISTEMFISMPQYHLSEGDIIMARRGDLSKVGIVNNSSEKLFCGTGSLFVRFKKNVNKLFLYKVLSDNSTTQFLMDKARGITMPNLNKTIIASVPIFIPPLDLQNQFAEKIALIEQQKELAKQSLAESENLFNALLQKAFKGELVPKPQPAEQAV